MPWKEIGFFVLLSPGTLGLGFLAVALLIARLPEDYFVYARRESPPSKHPLLHAVLVCAKNLAGLILVAVGAVLSLPGVPGQGLLLMLVGILLADFPGKHRLERWLVRRPRIARVLNHLRQRLRRPLLKFPEDK